MSKKVVAIGGGTGLSTLLSGIKDFPWHISAIVTMTDNGLSSGRLRRDFGILPPGDLRQCLIALSNDNLLLSDLFKYRFRRGKGLAGHSLGNLLILALEKITGSFEHAVESASKILAVKGEVIPSTYEKINLIAHHKNGKKTVGEREAFLIGKHNPIVKIELDRSNVKANPKAVSSIKEADVVLIGPGSLYTSIMPNLLINEIRNAIEKNHRAKKIYICNVSTERCETQGYTVKDHINCIIKHSGRKLFDNCLVNKKIIKTSSKEYKLGEVKNITAFNEDIPGINIFREDIIDNNDPLYHKSEKLAKVIWRISNANQQPFRKT